MATARPRYPVVAPTSRPKQNRRRPVPVRDPNSARPQPPPNPQYDRLNERNPRRRVQLATAAAGKRQVVNPVVGAGPITPEQALARYGSILNWYERKEILNFPEIYYVGRPNRKIIPDVKLPNNIGYDDETNNALLITGDHLAYRFEIVELFGAGAFGQVLKCHDHKLKTDVALKVIVNTDQMHEQGRIEAGILACLNRAESRHIVKAFDFFIFRNHVCVTFEILGVNLFELSEGNGFEPISARKVKMYAQQMFVALELCHRNRIIHCDIKPENVLLCKGSTTLVKLIDFGSSCYIGQLKYDYIQSRFYRAPEVLMGIKYGPPMDIWSTALVLIEMLIGKPIWPGDTELQQLWMISAMMGPPPQKLVDQGRRSFEFFERDGELKGLDDLPVPEKSSLEEAIGDYDPLLIDFLKKCLMWDQKSRMTAAEALRHPWIQAKDLSLSGSLKGSILPELTTMSRYA